MSGIVVVKVNLVEEHIKEFEKLLVAMNKSEFSQWTLNEVVMVSAINGLESMKVTYSEYLKEEENA